MEFGLLLIFWYGILHAFGPDHLAAIVDFSIGRERKKVLLITFGFALGHGLSLYCFALLLSYFDLPDSVLAMGDVIAASVILFMGAYLVFLALTDRIHIQQHKHNSKSHIHIWFGKTHKHMKSSFISALSASAVVGILMGMGGARGMLVSLSTLSEQAVTAWMIVFFTSGVALVFVIFGLFIAFLNQRLHSLQNSTQAVRSGFAAVGFLSCLIGGYLLV